MTRLRREDPRIVGPYRLHRRLGAGGMGVVYLGSDRKGQRVALKLIRAELAGDAEFRTRFAREIAAASRIRGGCTARVVGSDIEAERPWLATAYVPGPSLYKQVSDEGPMPWAEAARIGAALADGLVKVHEAGVVHRDLKPSNILLSPKGPRIIDFGIAWSRGASTLTHVGTAVGSPGFLAPEQVRGAPVTPATDVFAFGATLAYALTGESPFGSGASSEVLLYRVVHEDPDLSEVPPPLAPLVRACLAKEPTERPGAAALHERLTELAARGTAPALHQGVSWGGQAAGPGAPDGSDGAVIGSAAGSAGRVAGDGRGYSGAASAAAAAAAAEQHGGRWAAAQRAGGPVGGPVGAQRRAGAPADVQAVTAPMPRPDLGQDGVPAELRERRPRREQPQSARERRTPVPGRPARPRDRQHTPVPGRPSEARRRLLRQRVVVFVTVTVGVALAIAAAQGCENHSNQGQDRPGGASVSPSAPEAGGGTGLSADSVPRSPTPFAAVAHGTGDTTLGPATGTVPTVDWPNRSYSDPAGGPAIRLRDGRSTDGPQVALSTVLPARYRDAPAAVVVLRRAEGSVPSDLVELFSFSGGTPVLLASRTSVADQQAATAWRIENGALVREERSQTGSGSTTRYTVRGDGGLEESWPGAGVTGGTGGTPTPGTGSGGTSG
ncbi:serine/threonine-protein kinase [Saccharothrix sp. ST-888]|uniref:serine/threonine-protein kinase n=1 Tax=Saccharothrix sp. ST-888 TaxID=1427391 RepID=UPI0018CCB196|nr:serine/threonine-protein kinase [Saccharothrix sp. ST-888]